MTTKPQALAYFEQMGLPPFFQQLYAEEFAKDDITCKGKTKKEC